jgi:hypothetical protein
LMRREEEAHDAERRESVGRTRNKRGVRRGGLKVKEIVRRRATADKEKAEPRVKSNEEREKDI